MKVAHFIPVKTTYYRAKLVELYMARIMCLHVVPKKIVSDRGTRSVYLALLTEVARVNGYQAQLQLHVPSTDRWPY
jgi:hypothetical protein